MSIELDAAQTYLVGTYAEPETGVYASLAKYRTLDGLARAYPQWVPEETVLPFPRQALESAEHIIFHDNGICEMIPRAGSSKANIVPPTAADCGEEC